ncbi:MAG: hypothetical protein ACK46X_19100 [Candidatus Sericytochromatia bacterium]
MSMQEDHWDYDIARAIGSAGPAGRPKPLAADELSLVPEKGNLGGETNLAANGDLMNERRTDFFDDRA